MLEILAITAPIFLLIGVGYLAIAGRIISREQVRGVGTFVMYCALPALVIRALTQNPLEEVFDTQYLLAYGLGSLAIFVLGLAVTLVWQRLPLSNGAIQALGMAASNSGFIGYPVAAMVLGSPAAVFLALNMVIENLLIIPLALILAEMGHQRGASLTATLRQTARRLGRNPVLIGLLFGVLVAVSGISLPGPLARTIDMLADAAGPASLFVIGASLFRLQVRGLLGDVAQIVTGKLILHPLAILGAFLLMPEPDPALITGAMLFACAPMISVYPLFGQRYAMGGVGAAALMVATLLSFVTLSVAIGLLHLVGLLPA
ncbi:AEC family transporter [Billgrantia gudaonensis]|uniref:Permease n=1 Tax=Billgrantia gudaonensis TaxID=376427 RepID=A0A1G8Z8T7_9GAMM|nr:AEC family transporter [Halomonas gudaonensis]SDK11427.1 hypothetical protein SAMN04487954_111128 [Halomonas gudaonensis]